MAFFVEDDKEPEGKYSFYTCVSNGKEYKYEKQVADLEQQLGNALFRSWRMNERIKELALQAWMAERTEKDPKYYT